MNGGGAPRCLSLLPVLESHVSHMFVNHPTTLSNVPPMNLLPIPLTPTAFERKDRVLTSSTTPPTPPISSPSRSCITPNHVVSHCLSLSLSHPPHSIPPRPFDLPHPISRIHHSPTIPSPSPPNRTNSHITHADLQRGRRRATRSAVSGRRWRGGCRGLLVLCWWWSWGWRWRSWGRGR